MSEEKHRLEYVDGLRGLAVLMVVICHTWTQHPPVLWDPMWWHNKMQPGPHATVLDYIANRGYQGVSLFLVLSGFCLAYPALRRRADGAEAWFQPSHFFARRVLRILPPYYAALLVSIGLVNLFQAQHWPYLRTMGGGELQTVNVVSHILLLHNVTGYAYSINSPFWSLALEWQWYWLFPIVLVCAVRFPVPTAVLTAMLAMGWQGAMEDHSIIMFWLPGRLFEFCCGVLVARAVVRDFRCRPVWLALGALAAIAAAEVPFGTAVGDIGLYQPLYGVAFGLVLLLGHMSVRARRMFSWAPLVRLGIVSYSVYLVHRLASDSIESLAPLWLRSSELLIPTAAIAALGAGVLFYFVVERPCMSRRTWTRVGPALQRLTRWTDRLYGKLVSATEDGMRPHSEPVAVTGQV